MHHAPETVRLDGHQPALRRRLGLPLLVLYGVGITVGAGIYVLVGAVAAHAGRYSPWAFLLAGIVMAFTVASYIELSTRFPVSAGEAAYVRAAFSSRLLSTFVGLSTIVIGVMSASTVTLGAVGYVRQFIDLPQIVLVLLLLLSLGAVAMWGILESVIIAGLLTLVEVGGLVAIIVAGVKAELPIAAALATFPPLEFHILSGIATASLLAFFAFIGFEDLANIVEEAQQPRRDIPRAMVLTLVVSTVLYVVVGAVAVSAVSVDRLASSSAPLSLVFREVAGVSPQTISAIAIVATLNTILAQITMTSRVLYGMARQGDLPLVIGTVHPATATPWLATGGVVAAVAGLALTFPFTGLAESTSVATLAVFALVNLALLRLKYLRPQSVGTHVHVPVWMPVAGFASSLLMIIAGLTG
jgi:APA family basic amino acid/polyamine antiporter